MCVNLAEGLRFLAKNAQQHIGKGSLDMVADENRGRPHHELSSVKTHCSKVERLYVGGEKMIIHFSL
jgi:hypothetical protein